MDNQHRKIKGYRELSETEVALMNEIKDNGEKTKALITKLSVLRERERRKLCAQFGGTPTKLTSEQITESFEAINNAKNYLQTGQMWLVRAVALPESF